jgi:hypothetical protein
MGSQVANLIEKYLVEVVRLHLEHAASIIVHGSAATNETSLYSDSHQDILLGNVGLTIITNSVSRDYMRYILLMRRLRNIEETLQWTRKKPLVLLKPFEIAVIPYNDILMGRGPRDIWVYEMVNAGKVVYGKNLLHLFNPSFGIEAGFNMMINRLFSLNLSLPLLAEGDYPTKLKILTINYESTKAILGALEAFLVILGKYRPSYFERTKRIKDVIEAYPDVLDSNNARRIFSLASSSKLNPQDLDKTSPLEYWFEARELLGACLKIYNSLHPNWRKDLEIPGGSLFPLRNLRSISRFLVNGVIDPIILFQRKSKDFAIKQMLRCVFSFKIEDAQNQTKQSEILARHSRYANYIYTNGQLCQITDAIKFLKSKG